MSKRIRARAPHFWRLPWGYPQAFALAGGLAVTGIVLQLSAGDPLVHMPSRPWNLSALAVFMAALMAARFLAGRSPLVRALSSVPVGIASVTAVGLLSVIAGTVPQEGGAWLGHIIESWPFAFCALLMSASLGLAILRRCVPFRVRDWGWLANHLGLWLVVTVMMFGAGDIEKLRIFAYEGKTVPHAFLPGDEEGIRPVIMPFALRLDDFRMEEYPPRLVLAEAGTGKKRKSADLKDGMKVWTLGWELEVLRLLPSSRREGDGFVAATEGGVAVRIRATRQSDGKIREGWVSPVEGPFGPQVLGLDVDLVLAVESAPRLFRSDVTIVMPGGTGGKAVIQVNKPLTVAGWKLYQSSYDIASGKSSRMSVIDAVRDPWLPAAYAGMGLMLLGALSLFIKGIRSRVGGR